MNEIRTLLEKFWICKDTDKESFYRVKHDIPVFQRFAREQLGWKLIQTEHLIKLEKVPAHAEGFMGIQEFTEIRDYCIFCVVLMFLEDREVQEQFLLSELIAYVETGLQGYLEVDWTSFTQRKSLVRVLQYMENLNLLKVYEGSSEAFGQEEKQEVLYENTGYSKYFATSFVEDISEYTSFRDFEKPQEELNADRGQQRINRVYRQLVVCPAMYWDTTEDADSLYLRNQRKWVAGYLEENLGGRLEIHRNAAFWVLEEEDCYGKVHPRDAMLPEAVLLLCTEMQKNVVSGKWKRDSTENIVLTLQEFEEFAWDCRNRWKAAWSKEFRDMERDKFLRTVTGYMTDWMLLRKAGNEVCICPAAGKLSGVYPADFQIKEESSNE